jgi:hypothetical protein
VEDAGAIARWGGDGNRAGWSFGLRSALEGARIFIGCVFTERIADPQSLIISLHKAWTAQPARRHFEIIIGWPRLFRKLVRLGGYSAGAIRRNIISQLRSFAILREP